MFELGDINYKNEKTEQINIDEAWENKEYCTMLNLLQQNSIYPENFKLSDLTNLDQSDSGVAELKDFVEEREEFHKSIIRGDLEHVKSFLLKNIFSTSSLLFNCKQESAIETAAQHGSLDILLCLLSLETPISDERIKLTDEQEKLVNFINNDNGNSLLMLAVLGQRKNNTDFLLRCGIDVNYCNKVGHTAADIAWRNKYYDILLILLQADSNFPKNFSFEELENCDTNGTELQKFVNDRNVLHKLIEENNSKMVKNFIAKNKSSKFYLNSKDISALSTAVKYKKYETYAFLKSKNCQFKSEKEGSDSLNGLNETEKFHLKEAMLHHFIPAYQSHIFNLVSKSSSSTPVENFENIVRNYYTELDAIPEISIIMKVLQYADCIIVFDFNKESASGVNPTLSDSTKAVCEFSLGRIYIGAKGDKSEVLGTLAHEMTHYAMQIIYGNDCNPYGAHNIDMRNKFESITKNLEIQIQTEAVDDVIKRVFENYSINVRHSELVVRVPQLYAKYGLDVGQLIIGCQAQDLLKFYRTHVMPKCEKFVESGYNTKPRNTIKVMQKFTGDMTDVLNSNISLKQSTQLTDFLNSSHKILLLTTECEWLTCLGISQTLCKLHDNISDDSYLLLKFDNFIKLRKDVEGVLNCELLKVLLICFNTKTDHSSVIETLKILKPFTNDIGKKFIFIMHANLEPDLKYHLNQGKLPKDCEIHSDQQYTLLSLTEESQKIILNKKVTFQGQVVVLKDLINDSLKDIFNGETLYKLIKDEAVEIGSEISNLGEITQYYINRYFIKYVIRWENILEDKSEDIFAFTREDMENTYQAHYYQTNVRFSTYDGASSPVKFVLLDESNAETQFQSLCSQYPHKNIHWLHFRSGELAWKKTRGNLYYFRKYIEHSKNCEEIPEENFIHDNENKYIIISDTAGTGKSVILTKISEIIKQKNRFIYVININLNDHTTALMHELDNRKQIKQEFETFIKAYNFLADNFLKIKDDFNKMFLKQVLLQTNRAVFLFDGFDEISPDYADLVIDLLNCLGKSQVEHIIVSTRRNFKELLEDKLGVLSHSLRPFTKKDQVKFLTKFWKNCHPEFTDTKKLKPSAKMLVECFSRTINDQVKEFTGIPLLTRLLAEYDHELYNSEKKKLKLIENIDILALYSNFFKKTHDRYCKEKKKTDESNLATREDNRKQYKTFLQEHEILSLLALFKKEDLVGFKTIFSWFKDIDNYIDNLNDGKERTGIIDKVIDGKPHFIHQTFAENIAAAYFFSMRKKDKGTELQEFLRKNIFKPQNETLRKFFDYMCSESVPVITAAINNDMTVIDMRPPCLENISSEHFHTVDIERRNVLHLSSSHGSEMFLEMSLEYMKDSISNRDDLFKYTSLQYACLSCNWDCAEILLKAGANAADLIEIKSILFQICNAKSILHVASSNNYCHLAKAVFSLIDDIRELHHVLSSICFPFLEDFSEIITVFGEKVKSVLNYFDEQSRNGITNCDTENSTKNGTNSDTFNGSDTNSVTINDSKTESDTQNDASCDTCNCCNIECGANSDDVFTLDIVKENLKLSDNGAFTLLHEAAYFNKLNSVKALVKLGIININVIDFDGNTPLHRAAYCFSKSSCNDYTEIIKYLLDNGADVNKPNNIGFTPLHIALYYSHDLNVIKTLLKYCAEPNFGTGIGVVPLHCAILSGNLEAVQLMLDNGAEPYSKDFLKTMNVTSLHIAALLTPYVKSRIDIMKLLLKKFPEIINTKVNITGEDLAVLLEIFYEFSSSFIHILRNLAQKKLMSVKQFDLPLTACDIAFHLENKNENDEEKLVTLLKSHKAEVTTRITEKRFLRITKKYLLPILQSIMWESHKSKEFDNLYSYERAMCTAAQANNLSYLKCIHSVVRKINVAPTENKTPLHWAAAEGNKKIVKYILNQNDVLVNLKDIDGRTPLHLAAVGGHTEIVRILLDDRRVNVNETDKFSNTALDLAKKEEIVSILNKALHVNGNEQVTSDSDNEMETMEPLHH